MRKAGPTIAALLLWGCSASKGPPTPTLTRFELLRGAGLASVRVHGKAPAGTMVELYLTPDCRGIPRAAAPAQLFAAGLEVPLTGPGPVTIFALARDPERGASGCSAGLAIAPPAAPVQGQGPLAQAQGPLARQGPGSAAQQPPPAPAASWQELGLASAGDERALWQRVLEAQALLRKSMPAAAWEKLAREAPGFVPVGTLSLSLGKDPRFLTPDLNGDGAPDLAVLGVSRATALGAAVSGGETPAAPGPLLLELRKLRTAGGGQLYLGLSSAQGTAWLALPGGSGLTLVPGWAARDDKLPGCDPALPARADIGWARAHRCDALELDGSETDPVHYLLWDERTRAIVTLEDRCEKH